MAPKILSLLIVASLIYLVNSESDVISKPIPGQEYVFVHTSHPGARPVARKEKSTDASDRPFETAHKLPAILTFRQEPESEEVVEKDITKGKYSGKILKYKEGGKQKREAKDAVPAPAGSIKLDPKELIERYRHEYETIDPKSLIEKYRSEIEASKATAKTTKAPARRTTTARPTKKSRTKKEAPTTPTSVLTTGAPATPRTLQINSAEGAKGKEDKLASGTENKRSRIQIKKGPNGQEYEYEYVYYYYDEDVDEKKDGAAGKAKVTNAHDGPAKGSPTRARPSTTAHPEPAANEVVPSGRGTRQRGRQLTHEVPEEKVAEERLPQNTRFPPRSRNINTTPSTPEEEEPKNKNRQRGNPQGQPADSQVDETQVSRGRNRPNVRRPSLELVDSASFNTHSSNDPAIEPYKEPKVRGDYTKNSQGPSFPSELPEGPVRFLGATPNEKTDLQDSKTKTVDAEDTSTKSDSDATPTTEESATTDTSAMDKVALDLYAILQGTQKLSGEDKDETSTEDTTTTDQTSTDETTTELLTEELTTPSTTTTTTTEATTTTTTTTPEPVTGRGRFRGRPGTSGNRFKSGASPTTTSAPEVSTEKGKRFGRPFGTRPRPVGGKATTEAGEPEATKEDSKPVSNAKSPIGSRTRFSARGRPSSTTAAPESSDSTTASGSRSSFTRPRPGAFNLRRRGGATTTTKEPADGESPANEGAPQEEASTTAKPIRSRVSGNLSPRPLRPGPKLNLATRGRPGAPTSTTASPEGGAEHDNGGEETQQEGEDKDENATLPPGGNTLMKLRNRPKLTVTQAVRQRPAATAQVQVRRNNPLLARRKPVQAAEPSEAPTEASPEAGATDAPEEDAPSEAPSSTTEEPRGLNKLLAGRRRLARPPASTH